MKRASRSPAARGLRIGEAAAASGLTPDTLRYYERLGLLSRAARTSGGFRVYPADTVDRLRFVKTAQAHGLSLKEIHELVVNQNDSGRERCRRVRDVLSQRLADLEARRLELDAFCGTLRELLQMCERALASASASCPVAESLEHDAPRGSAG